MCNKLELTEIIKAAFNSGYDMGRQDEKEGVFIDGKANLQVFLNRFDIAVMSANFSDVSSLNSQIK